MCPCRGHLLTHASPSSARVAERCYIALGSNLGDRAGYLAAARAGLSLIPGTALIAASSVEETVPLGKRAQGPYLNQMVACETLLSPDGMLDRLHAIERSLGRVRTSRWGPRTIDLDIVRFGNVQMNTARLVIPHPGLRDRAFWQGEVAELDRLVGA
jgi:2-amino-4-hydroxy-6-hydroxymethyldihydropteridine diphosphokinase